MITNQDTLWLAALSKLCVKDDELDNMTAELNETVSYVSAISQLDMANKPYSGMRTDMGDLREDEVGQRYPQELLLANAGGGDKGYFPIKRRKADGK